MLTSVPESTSWICMFIPSRCDPCGVAHHLPVLQSVSYLESLRALNHNYLLPLCSQAVKFLIVGYSMVDDVPQT